MAHPRLGVVLPLLLVTAQVIVDYRTGAISDLHKLYYTHHLASHPLPYLDARIEYPVLIGVYMTLAAALTHGPVPYLQLSSLGLWACAVGSTLVLWTISRRLAWLFAICPLLLVYSLLNWDLLAVLFMLLGWRAWLNDRYGSAALWLTLGVFTKLYPIVLATFCLVELVQRARRGLATRRDVGRFAGVAVAVAAVVNGPFMVLALHNWLYFFTFSYRRDNQTGVLSYLTFLDRGGGVALDAALVALVATALLIGVLAISRGARPVEVAALFFFVFMLLQKVYSPQYALWLVVYALIAEWELWTIVLVSAVGLVDYGSAVVHIELVGQHSRLAGWYDRKIIPLEKGFRLGSIASAAAAMALRGRFSSQG